MANAVASTSPALAAPRSQEQKQREQMAATEVNGLRLRAIMDRLTSHYQGALNLPVAELGHLFYALARGIDYALSTKDVPEIMNRIPALLKKVYQCRNDDSLRTSLMVLVMSAKNACNSGWFEASDKTEISSMANEFGRNFCISPGRTVDDGKVLDIISTLIHRFFPQLKLSRRLVSLEAKMGYDILMADFFIPRDLPSDEKINLFVVEKDNLETSSCIITPQLVSFLVNGKAVDKRTNLSVDPGPQFPTDITKMLKYGANIIQAVGNFTASYIVTVAFVSKLASFDVPQLEDYAQPVPANYASDIDIIEGPSRVLLNCPISRRRIKTPVKGKSCRHHQCFDWENYVEMNSRKPSWRCPCCSTPASYVDLRSDQRMVKIIQEVGDDIVDVLIFADGSWKTDLAYHAKATELPNGKIVGHDGGSPKTDTSSANVVDLTMGENDEGGLPMNSSEKGGILETHSTLGENATSEMEDRKPFVALQDFDTSKLLSDPPTTSTSVAAQVLVQMSENWPSNLSSTSDQTGPRSHSFGMLESILPDAVLHPVVTDAVLPSLETSQSALSLQPASQVRQHSDNMQLHPLRDSLFGTELGRGPIPRHVRRAPVAIQALAVPSQNPVTSRRALPCAATPPNDPMSTTYQTVEMTDGPDGANTLEGDLEHGISRTSSIPSSSQVQSLQQGQDRHDIRSSPSPAVNRVIGLPAPHLMGTRPNLAQGRVLNAYRAQTLRELPTYRQMLNQTGNPLVSQTTNSSQSRINLQGPPQAPQPHDAAQRTPPSRVQLMGNTAALPHVARMQSPASAMEDMSTAPQVARVQSQAFAMADRSTAPQLGRSDSVPEQPTEQNWRPTGRMRGSLTGDAYSAALQQYLVPSTQSSQARPPGINARGPQT